MRKEIKLFTVVLLLILMTGCAALRKKKDTGTPSGGGAIDYSAVAADVMNYNITDRGFEIRKGSIELEGTEIEGKFGLHARMNSKGDFYASVRGPLGIELARLLAVGNDIAAIDRFNRRVYVGKKDAVMKKNGLPEDFMRILFGDMPDGLSGDYTVNGMNEMVMIAGDEEFMRELTICTDEMKICRERIDAAKTGHLVFLDFTEFRNSGGKRYASRITMEEKKRMFHVKLSIDDLTYGYDSDIEFSLPSYTRENL
jgi:hypothetical protein